MLHLFTPQQIQLLKAAAQIGEVRSWKTGDWKKISATKWVKVVGERKTEERQRADAWRKAQQHFDYAMTSSLGYILDSVLVSRGVSSFDDLTEKIKKGDRALSSNIYREVMEKLRGENAPLGYKRDLADNVGRALLILRDQFSTAQKVDLTIKKTNKKGKKYRITQAQQKVSNELPSLKPTVIRNAKKKVGGWNVTGPITHQNIKAMIANKTAKLTYGKIVANRKWEMPKKAEDMEFKYKGNHLLLKLRQTKSMKKGDKRASTTARVEIKLPYAYAKAFLLNHIKSVRTRNNFIFRLERSEGYRRFLEGATNG